VAKKQTPNPTAETLREIEASGDRLAEWASANATTILAAIAAVLLLAGIVGLYVQAGEEARDEAANALALATSQYRQEMGADPISGPIPEPANPELAEEVRSRFVERFADVARDHTGTAAGALAWLEAGHLQTELGRLEAAAESFGRARDEARGSAIEAIAETRLANLAEERGDLATAAEAYERAARIASYPLRFLAVTEATRCWLEAGEDERAMAAYQRLENEFPDEVPAPMIQAAIEELRAVGG
jgi:predicted negative regulator of RcsB-dependent stress response